LHRHKTEGDFLNEVKLGFSFPIFRLRLRIVGEAAIGKLCRHFAAQIVEAIGASDQLDGEAGAVASRDPPDGLEVQAAIRLGCPGPFPELDFQPAARPADIIVISAIGIPKIHPIEVMPGAELGTEGGQIKHEHRTIGEIDPAPGRAPGDVEEV
jgi:hypothetical protein